MIRINLIRDRAERPPSMAKRLGPVVPVLLVIAYVVPVVLFFALAGRFREIADGLVREVAREEQRADDFSAFALKYEKADLKSIENVQKIVDLYGEKWNWSRKLMAVQESLPVAVAITSFEGNVASSVRIRAHADDMDGKGLERLEELMRNLQGNETFMQHLVQVRLKLVGGGGQQRQRASDRLYFTIECPCRL